MPPVGSFDPQQPNDGLLLQNGIWIRPQNLLISTNDFEDAHRFDSIAGSITLINTEPNVIQGAKSCLFTSGIGGNYSGTYYLSLQEAIGVSYCRYNVKFKWKPLVNSANNYYFEIYFKIGTTNFIFSVKYICNTSLWYYRNSSGTYTAFAQTQYLPTANFPIWNFSLTVNPNTAKFVRFTTNEWWYDMSALSYTSPTTGNDNKLMFTVRGDGFAASQDALILDDLVISAFV